MRRSIKIMKVKEGWATVSIKGADEFFEVPLQLLPQKSRQGDIIQLNLSFSPFETLNNILLRESDNSSPS